MLALVVPLRKRGLGLVLDELDEQVAGAGDQVYLSKNGQLESEVVRAMHPCLDEWNDVRRRFDPKGVLVSDVGPRLWLTEKNRHGREHLWR